MCALRAVLPTLSEKNQRKCKAALRGLWWCLCAFLRTSGFSALLPFCVRSHRIVPTPQIAERHETTTRQFVAQFPTLPSDKGVTLADALAKDRNKTPPPCPSDRSQIPHILAIYFNLLFIICFFLSFFHGMRFSSYACSLSFHAIKSRSHWGRGVTRGMISPF